MERKQKFQYSKEISKKKPTAAVINSNNNAITINNPATGVKRGTSTVTGTSSGCNTWNTNEKPKKKRKYLSTAFYGDSDFGVNSQWIISNIIMAEALKKYRQITNAQTLIKQPYPVIVNC